MDLKLENKLFLESIVWVNHFNLNVYTAELDILSLPEGRDGELKYRLHFKDVVYFEFRQYHHDEEGFAVIESCLDKFNVCPYVSSMHNPSREDLYVFHLHSGEHHLLIGFREYKISDESLNITQDPS